MLQLPQNFEILVSTPNNYGSIEGSRDKNFEVPRLFEHRYWKTKVQKGRFFLQHPFSLELFDDLVGLKKVQF